MNVIIIDSKGNKKIETVNPLGLIGDKKRELGVPNAIWKFDGQVLKNDKTFQFYEIQNGDNITTNVKHQGGIND